MKYLVFILCFTIIACNKQQKNNVSLKKNDATLIGEIFSSKNYEYLLDFEISRRDTHVKKIWLRGKKKYLPNNLHLFDSLKYLGIDLPNLKEFPKLGKVKSLSHLYLNFDSFFFSKDTILFPKDYIHIDKYIEFVCYNNYQKIKNIIFPKGMKVNTLYISVSIEKILETLKNLKYLNTLGISITSKVLNFEHLPNSLEKLILVCSEIEDIDFNKLPKNIKHLGLECNENKVKDYRNIFEEGKKRKVYVSINGKDNGVKYPKIKNYFWAEL